MHFETPKNYDCFSWGALWNPLDFYIGRGFNKFIDNQFSHDGYFLCNSPVIERLVRQELGAHYNDFAHATVNHTLSGPVYPPQMRENRRLAYCGINHERLSGRGGRFENLLKSLDQIGILDIYGPKTINNIPVWEGFNGYRHEVPFDGTSLIHEIAKSGAVLALSSDAHLRSEIMTSRLFEGAAAGALVITDNNRFVKRYFPDTAVQIDISGDHEKDSNKIIEIINYYNNNKEESYNICKNIQEKYIESFMLHKQILNVYKIFSLYMQKKSVCTIPTEKNILYIIIYHGEPINFLENIIDSIKKQKAHKSKICINLCKNQSKMLDKIKFHHPDIKINFMKEGFFSGFDMFDSLELFREKIEFINITTPFVKLFHDYDYYMVTAINNSIGSICGVVSEHTGIKNSADYWRPRKNRKNIHQTLSNILIKESFLMHNSSAIQMLGYDGIVDYMTRFFGDMAIIDRPLVQEIDHDRHKLGKKIYVDESIFINRYAPAPSNYSLYANYTACEDKGKFFEQLRKNKKRKLGLFSKISFYFFRFQARMAARKHDWPKAAYYYSKIILGGTQNHTILVQYGHTLKEQGFISAARYSYYMAHCINSKNEDKNIYFTQIKNI